MVYLGEVDGFLGIIKRISIFILTNIRIGQIAVISNTIYFLIGIVFLRKIIPGKTDKSYGIHVARIAGLPQEVIANAQKHLIKLEKEYRPESSQKETTQKEDQLPRLDLFSYSLKQNPPKHRILEEITQCDINKTTPLDAFSKLAAWQAELLQT